VQNKRLYIYLGATFAITWTCWWTLATEVPPGSTPFASGLSLTMYLLGGFGPTIGAYVAVVATPPEGSLLEYNARLFRFRVNPLWYLAVALVPPTLAFGKEWIARWVGAPDIAIAPLEPLARIFTLFPTMIIGGGLEELGWRGVAQPSLERLMPRSLAALCAGLIWAVWHFPLFHLHGVSQFDGNFPLFALDVIANAALLAWIYDGTQSIFLCVLFHAASNTTAAMGLVVPDGNTGAAWVATAVKLVIAMLLLKTVSTSNTTTQTTRSAGR
jgi:membrane protease YdiL (CAAX protease family)